VPAYSANAVSLCAVPDFHDYFITASESFGGPARARRPVDSIAGPRRHSLRDKAGMMIGNSV